MSGPDRPDPERGFATPGVDPRRVPPSDEQATTALPRHPTPPEHVLDRPDATARGPSDDAATTWYPRPDPPPRRDDRVYRDPYPDRAPGAPPYDDRKSPYDHRARPDDSKDPRRRPYPPDDEYDDRRPPSEYRDQRGYPADDPTGRGGGRAGNGAGYGAYYYGSDGPDYRRRLQRGRLRARLQRRQPPDAVDTTIGRTWTETHRRLAATRGRSPGRPTRTTTCRPASRCPAVAISNRSGVTSRHRGAAICRRTRSRWPFR